MPRRRKPADPLRWFDSVLEVIRLVTPSPCPTARAGDKLPLD